ncbi:hypothetical protein [Archaeoglobus neptunius]|uniref:hypothetical protein n=1 Tax=Archaeoglobus neptunius TaxID=2798580 RepID=UPI00192954FB|nr:hypothetical protein [Archaeoglobus neptunius]
MNVTVEKGKPELTGYEVKNLWEKSLKSMVADSTIDPLLALKTIIGNPYPIWVRMNSSFSNHVSIREVKYTTTQYEPFTFRQTIDAMSVGGGKYTANVYFRNLGVALSLFLGTFFGVELWFITTPDVYWTEISAYDFLGLEHKFTINERLPTLEDAAQGYQIKGNYYIAVWFAPFGSDRIDVLITDPAGRNIGTIITNNESKILNEIPNSTLLPDVEVNESQMMLGLAIIPNPLPGEYVMTVYGKEEANYTLQTIWWNNGNLTDKTTINDSIEKGEVKTIKKRVGKEVRVDVIPPIIHKCLKHGYMMTFVELPEGELNESSIKLNYAVSPVKVKVIEFEKQFKKLKLPKHKFKKRILMAMFKVRDVINVLSCGRNEVTVSGATNKTQFYGKDTVRLICR